MDIIFAKKSNIKDYIKYDFQKFKNEKRNLEYFLGRYLALYGAKKLYNSNFEIVNKTKPEFKNSNLKFSISHSFDIVAVAFCDFDIGLDVEIIKERNFSKLASYLKCSYFDKISFYQYWTQFEAGYKNNKNKNLTSFIFEDYMFSISSFSANEKFMMYELKIPKNSANLKDLISLKEINDNNINENLFELIEINKDRVEFLAPL